MDVGSRVESGTETETGIQSSSVILANASIQPPPSFPWKRESSLLRHTREREYPVCLLYVIDCKRSLQIQEQYKAQL